VAFHRARSLPYNEVGKLLRGKVAEDLRSLPAVDTPSRD
jgi:hypothetical protein